MKKNRIITVQDIPVTITQTEIEDYICITDIAAAKSDDYRAADVIKNWMRNRNTLEFLGTWESMYNPKFKVVEFEHFMKDKGGTDYDTNTIRAIPPLVREGLCLHII